MTTELQAAIEDLLEKSSVVGDPDHALTTIQGNEALDRLFEALEQLRVAYEPYNTCIAE